MPQLGKLLKKEKNLPDKYDDHLQEHRKDDEIQQKDFILSSTGTDETVHRYQ